MPLNETVYVNASPTSPGSRAASINNRMHDILYMCIIMYSLEARGMLENATAASRIAIRPSILIPNHRVVIKYK